MHTCDLTLMNSSDLITQKYIRHITRIAKLARATYKQQGEETERQTGKRRHPADGQTDTGWREPNGKMGRQTDNHIHAIQHAHM